jgi:hypothetical protein
MAIQFSSERRNDGLHAYSGETTLGLLRHFLEDVATLFRQEMALARAEIGGVIQRVTAGVGAIATGALLLLSGFMVLLAAAVLGLALVVEPWLAALIVGVVVAAVGAIILFSGLKALSSATLKPTRSIESLARDKEVLTGSHS